MRWTFGVEPLSQTEVAAALLRRVAGLVVAMEAADPAVDRLVTALRAAERELDAAGPSDPHPRVGPRAGSDGRIYLDHSRDIGEYNPCFPEYDITVDGERARGTVTFPTVYEGPPGVVHGGFIALLIDCVVQHHNCDLGVAGKTSSLSVRFRRPTPLLEELRFEVDRRRRRASHHVIGASSPRWGSVRRGRGPGGGGGTSQPPRRLTPEGERVIADTVRAGDALPLTVPALLRHRAAHDADSVMLVCDEDVLTYGEAARRSATVARGLLAIGAGRGAHVGVLQPNGSDFVVASLAAARIGAVAVPLSTFSTSHELASLLGKADVAALLCASSYRSHDYVAAMEAAVPELDLSGEPPLLASTLPVLRHVVFSRPPGRVAAGWSLPALEAAGSHIAADVLSAAEDEVSPADRLVIVHTSGSMSEPKGVIHTHGALIRHLSNLNEIRRYTCDEVLFSNSPFFWIGGYAYSMLGTLIAGGRLVCSNAQQSSAVLDLLEGQRPTMVNGFAQSVAHLAEDPTFAGRDLSSIRRGNLWPIMPADVRPRHPELRHNMLGMTETGSVCLASADEEDQPEHRRGSFGRPVPGFETRVVDVETGMACTAGEQGELHVRGPFMMEGYYGRERHETFDPDGWFATGDLVVVDDDGFFYFRGRRGEMIKTAGANVSPREVEQAILETTGLQSHVVGLDDEARGEIVVAAVVVPAGQSLDEDELRTRLAGRLSAYKVPRRFVLLAEGKVPMMSSGKIDLRALRALVQ